MHYYYVLYTIMYICTRILLCPKRISLECTCILYTYTIMFIMLLPILLNSISSNYIITIYYYTQCRTEDRACITTYSLSALLYYYVHTCVHKVYVHWLFLLFSCSLYRPQVEPLIAVSTILAVDDILAHIHSQEDKRILPGLNGERAIISIVYDLQFLLVCSSFLAIYNPCTRINSLSHVMPVHTKIYSWGCS